MKPLISIIIVNFNGLKFLDDCLSSIFLNSFKDFEIIFVDNCSSDESVSFVKQHYPKVKVIENTTNSGYAGGNNVGYKVARGEYILILNNDTTIEKHFLQDILRSFEEIPKLACVQPKIVLMKRPEIIDSCGAFLTKVLFLYHYGYDKPEKLPEYNKSFRIFAAKGACMLLKKEVIEKTGLFDDDFWCYYEETDFCHRLWLAGFECWYYPKAKIYHLMGGTSLTFNSSFVQFQNFKNRLTSFIKNFEAKTLIKYLPLYLITNIILSIFWLFSGKPSLFISLYNAIFWNIKHIGKTIEKRKKVQKLRKVTDKEIFAMIRLDPKWNYYYYLFKGLANFKDEPIKV